jgi:hypothetical protein
MLIRTDKKHWDVAHDGREGQKKQKVWECVVGKGDREKLVCRKASNVTAMSLMLKMTMN